MLPKSKLTETSETGAGPELEPADEASENVEIAEEELPEADAENERSTSDFSKFRTCELES